MDTRDNHFKVMPEKEADKDFMIPFDIGERVTIKGYEFEVYEVHLDTNLLLLKPIRVTEQSIKEKLAKLKAKGGLGNY